MYEEDLVDCLELILDSIGLIETRFQNIPSPGQQIYPACPVKSEGH